MEISREHLSLMPSLCKRWRSMIERCHKPSDSDYKNYGGRGIQVYDKWREEKYGFVNFFDHVSKLPHFGEKGYSLDRIDNDGNYEPNNVRWANSLTQSRNRRCVRHDQGQTLVDISNETGIPIKTLAVRWQKGDRGERLRRPMRKLPNDAGQNLTEISKETGVSYGTIMHRWSKGERGKDLRRTPKHEHVLDNGQTIQEIAQECGVTFNAIWERYRNGERGEQLRRTCRCLQIIDEGQTLRQISAETGISICTLRSRYQKGWRGAQLRQPLLSK